MRVNPKIRLQTPILMLCIGILSGCVTIESLAEAEKSRFEKVLVLSTLGDVFSGNERPYSSVFSKSSKFSYAVDFSDYFEQVVIAHLVGKVPFELEALSETSPTDFSGNFISGKRASRIQIISSFVRDSGFDGMLLVQGHDFLQGDIYAGNVYDFNELGMCFKKMPFKDERHLNVFSNFYLYFLDAEQEKTLFWDYGFSSERADVQLDSWPPSAQALDADIREALIDQSVSVAVKSILRILDFQFFGISDE